MIDFGSLKTTADESRLIARIAARTQNIAKMVETCVPPRSFTDLAMDLEAAHHVCPLRLADLLAADDGDFGHDVGGIVQHLDRDTGELTDCFCPRFAVRT